ncbi:hypothetical protein APHAL10511_003154 [Amanita phalloides]|nr:hypothetical protein APHAL10511_003154 [Amanita phalloides]
MGKMGKSLKSTLQAQQSRLQKQKKALQVAQAAEQKAKQKYNGKGKGKGKAKAATSPAKRQTIPFRPIDKVLLIGEGNFSFTRALVRLYDDEAAGGSGGSSTAVFMPPTNITATAYDSEEDCYAKYPDAKEIVEQVTKSGVQVLFGADATKLHKLHALKGKKWDKIIWNFPHTGECNGFSEHISYLFERRKGHYRPGQEYPVESTAGAGIFAKNKSIDDEDEDNDDEHQDQEIDDETLLYSSPLFASSDSVKKTWGTVLITLRNVPPYTLWDVPRLAKKPPPPVHPTKVVLVPAERLARI